MVLGDTTSSGSSNKSTPTQIHTPKELVKLLLNGQKSEVAKILAALPKDEADALKKKLLQLIDAIQQRHRNRVNASIGSNKSDSVWL